MEDEPPGTREANKTCGVCGDRALGYNFNAVSCESCKAFFRRNALKNKDFRCPFTENCNVTPVTRRFCQKCRLDKCFSIGMRKEYIMTEEDKVLKREKIERNKAKKRSHSNDTRKTKMKREVVDDDNFDDTSVSVTSVASTISETYFWESDKKYADLDTNRQLTLESMSPVTAASVPSPSSPPENRNIIGSKTLDMLKDSISNVNYNSKKCHNDSRRENVCSANYERIIDSKDSGNCSRFSYPNNSCDFSIPKNNNISDEHSSYLSKQDKYKFDVSHNLYKRNENYSNKIENEKKEMEQINLMNITSKLTGNPDFLLKFMNSNPNLVKKILQDKYVVAKFLADPEVRATLASDSLITRFIDENDSQQDSNSNILQHNEIPEQINHDMVDSKENNIEHPILTNLITSNKYFEKYDKIEDSNVNTEWTTTTDDVARDVLQDVQRLPIAVNSIESILCQAIKLEFSAYSTPGGNQNNRQLNDAERAKLNELIVANKALLAPLDDEITNLIGEDCKFKGNTGLSDPMLLDVINLTAVAIRRIIKMCKKINAFKNMCQEDQLALLKGGCTEMMMLRSVMSYDSAKEMWKIPHSQESMSEIKAEILKEIKGNLYAEHGRFVRTFDPRWRDENIILILSAIALFTPDRPRVVHSDVIKLEQNSYYYLLRRYLESVYPGCEAKSMFLKLIQKISELHRLSNEVVGVYLNVNPSAIEPLLIEIFDLKH
ncbi:hypothetical protein PV327_001146 [Microctonus hyperodae]|uniref:Nuclear hormone receptor HR96 n=1 Tax=Microctonus hyperodae TaxID=165561 RepID=A0AA39G7M2_MICHY|nr:hypothetical protein PV327_001146 [Microctonus hyperodae]